VDHHDVPVRRGHGTAPGHGHGGGHVRGHGSDRRHPGPAHGGRLIGPAGLGGLILPPARPNGTELRRPPPAASALSSSTAGRSLALCMLSSGTGGGSGEIGAANPPAARDEPLTPGLRPPSEGRLAAPRPFS